jgi:acetyltransferase-like isoleucine patch superfamily enzyme
LKRSLKNVVYFVALCLVLPFALSERLARRLLGRDVWFSCHNEFLSLIPGKIGWFLRNAYLHLTLRHCPLSCCFLFGTLFTHSEAEVGDRVYMGAHCIIGMATVGDETMLADRVHVLSGGHQHGTAGGTASFQDQPQHFTRVRIGRNCWVGTNVVIMADVGDNCVIGAGSVVTKPIPDNSVAVGNPARIIRSTLADEAAKSG